jgi:hypothetical protein
MRTRVVSLMTSSFRLLGIVMIMTCSLSTQAQVNEINTTDLHDLTGAMSPVRVIVARTQQDGRRIETRTIETPSINGGYATLIETEQQTIQLSPNAATVVKRQYSRDVNGNRQLLEVTEEQRSTAAGGRETVVRTTSSTDVNGRLQVVQRDVRETAPTSEDTRQTTTTVSRLTANGFQPVQRSQQIEQRKGDVAEQQTTVLAPDGNGNFVPISRTESTTTKTASGQTKDERSYGDTGLSHMIVVQRDVSSESKDAEGTHSTTQTYSAFVSGASPDPGGLVLVQQVTTSRQPAPDGSSQSKQQIQAISLGNPASGLQLATSITEVSQPASNGQTKRQIVRSSDGNGAFPVVRVTYSHEIRIIPEAAPTFGRTAADVFRDLTQTGILTE